MGTPARRFPCVFFAIHAVLCLSVTAVAGDQILTVPQLEKPAAKPAEGDPFQAKYDAAWTRFEEAIGKATAELTKALDAQFEKAADAGNLELADMWDKKKKFLLDTKTLEWPTDGKAKVEWRKTNPKVEFPDDFSDVVASAQQAYVAAIDALKADYDGLVKEYTKARNIERAKQVKEEMAALDKKPAAPPVRVPIVEEKPAPGKQAGKPAFPIPGKYRTSYNNDFTTVVAITGQKIELIRMGFGGKEEPPREKPMISVTSTDKGVAVRYLWPNRRTWHEEWEPTPNGMKVLHWMNGAPRNGPPTQWGQSQPIDR